MPKNFKKAIEYIVGKKCKEVALKILNFEKEYAAPTQDKIAVFMPNSSGQFSEQFLTYRHILLRDMNGQIVSINEMNPLYDPLHYQIMFPYGDLGYEYQKGKNLTPQMHYQQIIQI